MFISYSYKIEVNSINKSEKILFLSILTFDSSLLELLLVLEAVHKNGNKN